MPESLVQVTEGVGKKLHTFQRAVGANNVEDEVMLLGEQYQASYVMSTGTTAVSVATANDHVLQIMAGASLNVYIDRIEIYQVAMATTAAISRFDIFRLSTAGTGGTARTAAPLDLTDTAAGCAGMTLPTAKGTETTVVYTAPAGFIQTFPTAGQLAKIADIDFGRLRSKALRISAGVANGIAVKIGPAVAAATVIVDVQLRELSF